MKKTSKSKQLYFVSPTHCSSDYNGECDYCIVPLDKALINNLQQKMLEVRRLTQTPTDNFLHAEWLDNAAMFVAPSEAERMFGDQMQPLDDGHDSLLLFSSVFPEDVNAERTEVSAVKIGKEVVNWGAYPKHSDAEVESKEFDPFGTLPE